MTDTPLKMDQFKRPDPVLTSKIVTQLKSQGIFDEFRRECMADVDTKPAYQNLRQRVEGSVAAFLKMNPWRPDMNKNQLRDNLRKHIQSGGFLDIGVDRIVDQVVNPKIYTVFLPKVEEVVQSCLGMNKDKPKPEPSPPSNTKPEPAKFQNKHNLAPRAALTGPRMPLLPTTETLKPLEPTETKEEKFSAGEGNSPTTEKPTNESFVMDEEEVEDADDDEESPPFEPHSQSDRLILGVRTDSSDSNSSDNQVVTTIVDDNLEERIDNNDEENNGSGLALKEDRNKDKDDLKKADGFTSDDSVPKTPTINMENSDGTMIEFNSISEYKRYQNKFGEDSIDNVEEEVVFSQWGDDSNFVAKEERNSNHEEHFQILSQKRKFNFEHFDEKSSSSFDKSSSCDEGKSDSFSSSTPKKVKLEDDNETINELIMNDDSNTDKSLDVSDIKHKLSSNKDKSKRSSSSSKEGRIHSHHHSHKEQKDSSSHHMSSSKGNHGHRESSSSHSSRDKHDKKDPSKEREKSKDSSHKHHSKESKSKYSDKDKGNHSDKKKLDKSELNKKDKNESDKDRKESRHKHEHKSRDHHDKEKKKHDNHDKNSDGKKEYDSSHKQSSDRKDNSKHSHSSSKHGHRSSSDKHRSDKDHKHKHPSEKHKSQEKNSEKDSKHDLKKKQKDYCKSSSKDFEGRRSSDRDSNGPSGTNNFSSSSTYKSVTSKRNVESSAYSSDKITSNSDNSVSENIEPMQSSKFESVSESGIASPDPETTEYSWNEFESELDKSKVIFGKEVLEIDKNSFNQNPGDETIKILDQTEYHNFDHKSDSCNILSSTSKYPESIEIDENSPKDRTFQELKELSVCIDYTNHKQDISTPVLDTSSEKENIDIADCFKESENTTPEVNINSEDKVVKFKKPKIAANIFEVRKIMQERRHLKRMEKKRLKLLMKTNTTECSTPESSPEMKAEEQDMFLGFDDVSENKLEKYDCLISRLNSEISVINNVEVNPNLITSLIEVNPNLDEYIETVLRGKVHRKTRVRLPPISDECYKYDSEQNAYILIKNACDFVDSNLNNLNPTMKGQELHINNISNNCIRQHTNTPGSFEETCLKIKHDDVSEESLSPKSDSENKNFILQASLESDDSKSPTCMLNNNNLDDRNKELGDVIDLEDQNLAKVSDDVLSIGMPSSSLNAITPTSKVAFSLTFNQTYDDILKEKEQNTEHENKQSKGQKEGSTVVKITKNKTTEQVILKKVGSGFLNNSHVPKISRSESVINGKLTNSAPQMKQVPLIRRISKSNNLVLAPSSSVKSQCLNGVASPDSTNFEAEVALPDKISPKIINDMIGIGGNMIGQRQSTGETWLRQKDNKQHQRYDSSDLYKPRIQLVSRRVRGGQSSPESETPTPTIITRKRAAVTPEVAASIPKRRR